MKMSDFDKAFIFVTTLTTAVVLGLGIFVMWVIIQLLKYWSVI
jgi:hypothetical protein